MSGESFLTMCFEARSSCNEDPNHMEIPCLLLSVESVGAPFLGADWEVSAWHWVPTCRAMDASMNVCSFPKLTCVQRKPSIIYFLLLLLLQVLVISGYFWLLDCHELGIHDCTLDKRAQSGGYTEKQVEHKWDLPFLLLCLTCGNIFTENCPDVS